MKESRLHILHTITTRTGKVSRETIGNGSERNVPSFARKHQSEPMRFQDWVQLSGLS